VQALRHTAIFMTALAAGGALSPSLSHAQDRGNSGAVVVYDEKQLAAADDFQTQGRIHLRPPHAAAKPTIALDLGPKIARDATPHAKPPKLKVATTAATTKPIADAGLPRLAITTEAPAPLTVDRPLYGAARDVPVSDGQGAVAGPNLAPSAPDSASIEHLGTAHNMTVVLPLFRVLDSVSAGPAPD
jgi:hypothetical protein